MQGVVISRTASHAETLLWTFLWIVHRYDGGKQIKHSVFLDWAKHRNLEAAWSGRNAVCSFSADELELTASHSQSRSLSRALRAELEWLWQHKEPYDPLYSRLRRCRVLRAEPVPFTSGEIFAEVRTAYVLETYHAYDDAAWEFLWLADLVDAVAHPTYIPLPIVAFRRLRPSCHYLNVRVFYIVNRHNVTVRE
jgi:hypothetical protein